MILTTGLNGNALIVQISVCTRADDALDNSLHSSGRRLIDACCHILGVFDSDALDTLSFVCGYTELVVPVGGCTPGLGVQNHGRFVLDDDVCEGLNEVVEKVGRFTGEQGLESRHLAKRKVGLVVEGCLDTAGCDE